MKDSRTLISAFFVLLASMALTGCATTPLYDAAYEGNIKKVEVLLNNGIDVNVKGGGGLLNDSNALDAASHMGHTDIVKLLLDRGANVNAAHGNMGWTPLSSAAWRGHTDVIKLLIERGADINKAIFALNRGSGTGNAIELLKEYKRERVAGQSAMAKPSAENTSAPAAIKSDIDELPAVKAKLNKNSYAIVIGIESYRQKLPAAAFAVQDARLVAEYLTKVLGYREENIVAIVNDHATKGDFEKYFEKWLPNNVEPGSTVFVYYSGHGAPNAKTGDAYLVPYDGDPSFIDETGYSLKRMYAVLGKLPAKEVIVALDSCFSGAGGRSVIAKGSRPLVMNLQSNVVLSRNMTVLSASSGDQTSSTYDEKGHGLFTYFMLKGIKNEDVTRPDGSLKIDDLYGYLKPQVERIARKQYNNEQTPQLIEPKKN
jgi:hypothetical protein